MPRERDRDRRQREKHEQLGGIEARETRRPTLEMLDLLLRALKVTKAVLIPKCDNDPRGFSEDLSPDSGEDILDFGLKD